MKIAVVGSREWPDPALVERAVHALVGTFPPGTVVVSGGAGGVDRWAKEAAWAWGLGYVEHPAEWDRHGRSAGFRRNRTIVADADRGYSFWNGTSRGTEHTFSLARSLHKPWWVGTYDARGLVREERWECDPSTCPSCLAKG